MPSFVTTSYVGNPSNDNPVNLLTSMSSVALDVIFRQQGNSITGASSGLSATNLNYNTIAPSLSHLVTLSAVDNSIFQVDQVYHGSQMAMGYSGGLSCLFTVNTAASAALTMTDNGYDTDTYNKQRKWNLMG